MNMNVVFICDACPREEHLDFFARPIGLGAVDRQRERFTTEDGTVVHAGGVGILVAPGANRRPVPVRSLATAGVDASAGWSGPCVRQGRADNGWFGLERSSSVSF